MFRIHNFIGFAGAVAASIAATSAAAQDDWRANYSIYGTPGIIDMPSASTPADGEVSTTVAVFGDTQRATFSFQVLPRVTGSFRYSLIDTYDRSFDVQYQITGEGRIRPSIAIGLRDFIGTGRYSSEYIVATKTVSPNVRISGGLGWGRLGSVGGFSNPLGVFDDRFYTRPDDTIVTGGTVLTGQFFRGDAAIFGGVEWRVNDDWTVLAEYSSDAYTRETALVGFDRKSPLNFGVKWAPSDTVQLGAYYMYGTDVGISATFTTDPTSRRSVGGYDSAPLPVVVRPADVAAAATWANAQAQTAGVATLGTAMETDGFRLLSAEVVGDAMRVRYENTQYRAEAQGVGRVARILTAVAPANVDTFVLEPSQRGIALSSVTVRRGDLETLENTAGASALMYDRAGFDDASGPAPAIAFEGTTPAFLWGIAPFLEVSLFDGDNPLRGNAGLEATFQYEIQPNLVLAGAYRQRLGGNRSAGSISPSTLPPVRREVSLFGAENNGGIENLSMSWYARPGRDIYSRVSVGYFERQFGGVSGEVLWKPVDSQLAVGAELNYAMRRDFDLGFGFQDYEIVTGHVSAYYDLDNGFQAQLDVGQYLAGDVGATFTVDREFENGWKVGAYFTLTNVDFADFGEGSFDKGIRVEIPLDWRLGTATRDTSATTLSSLSRDGGARLIVDGRLYDVVEGGHQGQMAENWGRFWR